MFELAMLSSGQAIPLGEEPLHVGRGPANHLVLSDDTVSWNHAQIWVEANHVWVRDLGSRNGTFRNDTPIAGPTPIEKGDELRFGRYQRVKLRQHVGFDAPSYRVLTLEVLATGTSFMLRSNRFYVGSGVDAHLRVPELPERAATIMLHGEEVWVGTDDEEFQVQIGEEFRVAGQGMRVVAAKVDHVPTVEWGAVRYPYDCRAVANGPRGPEVVLTGPDGVTHRAEGNRAVLLLLLARSLAKDRSRGVAEEEEGWISDESVRTGIWGRGKGTKSGLNVLVHRTRKNVQSDGFDPWFIEKKRRGIRARLRKIEVV